MFEYIEFWLIDRLIDYRLIFLLYARLIDRLINWLVDWSFDWLIDCSCDGLIRVWSIDWSIDWLIELSFSATASQRHNLREHRIGQHHQQSENGHESAGQAHLLPLPPPLRTRPWINRDFSAWSHARMNSHPLDFLCRPPRQPQASWISVVGNPRPRNYPNPPLKSSWNRCETDRAFCVLWKRSRSYRRRLRRPGRSVKGIYRRQRPRGPPVMDLPVWTRRPRPKSPAVSRLHPVGFPVRRRRSAVPSPQSCHRKTGKSEKRLSFPANPTQTIGKVTSPEEKAEKSTENDAVVISATDGATSGTTIDAQHTGAISVSSSSNTTSTDTTVAAVDPVTANISSTTSDEENSSRQVMFCVFCRLIERQCWSTCVKYTRVLSLRTDSFVRWLATVCASLL